MKRFKSLKEMRKYHAAKSLKAYYKKMSNPLTAEAYRIKRRKYERKRYKELMEELKNQS